MPPLLLSTESIKHPLTGIGNYTLNLLREFNRSDCAQEVECFDGSRWLDAATVLSRYPETPAADTDASCRQSPAGAGESWLYRLRKAARGMPLAYQAKATASNLMFHLHARKRPHSVYHEPNFVLKPYRSGPAIATIHDLSFVHFPQFHPPERVAWLQKQLSRTLQRADCLITDSELVRQDLLQRYRLPADQVVAIPLGVEPRFAPQSAQQTAPLLDQYGLRHGEYILFVGTLEPRKGLDTLLDGYLQLPPSVRKHYPLVLAGSSGWRNHDLMQRIRQLQQQGELHYLQFVSAQQLPNLYAGAALLAYPSHYEGFGLPVLEAMASGIPVICTEGTSMMDFAEGVAQTIMPGDAEALTDALRQLLDHPQRQREMAAAGLMRAREYTWHNCAQATCALYARVA